MTRTANILTDSTLIRVAIYLRRSTERQEDSIDRQRSQIRLYCDRAGYVIVAEYVDDRPGDAFRPSLVRLLADAAAGKCSLVIVDEWSRLSRQNLFAFSAEVASPLMKAGVQVETVCDGKRFDWHNDMDAILMAVHAVRSSGESKHLSRRVLTEMAKMAQEGRYIGGRVAYGYQREGEDLAVAPLKAKIVAWIFERFLAGWGCNKIATELNRRGQSPPDRAARWKRQTIRAMLRNPVYVGICAWNRRSTGKHFAYRNGRAVPVRQRLQPNERAEWIISPRKHEAIVSQEDFERVQDFLDKRTCYRPARGKYTLSGLLYCSCCGRRLHGVTRYGKVFYFCQPLDDTGKTVCNNHGKVEESTLLQLLLRHIKEEFLRPERLDQLRQEIARQEQQETSPRRLATLEKTVRKAEQDVARAQKNLATAGPEDRDDIRSGLAALRNDLRAAESELEAARACKLRRSLEETLQACEQALWRLDQVLAGADSLELRGVLAELFSKVVLHWDTRPSQTGIRRRHIFKGGVAYMRVSLDKHGTAGLRR